MAVGKGFKVIEGWYQSRVSKRDFLSIRSDSIEFWIFVNPGNKIIEILKPSYKEGNDFFNICCELVKNQPKFKSVDDSKDYVDNMLKRAFKLILYS